MRWFIIRTIWLRELRDQLRDRRTLFMIVGLPLLLYPVLSMGVLQFALGFKEQPSRIGVVIGPSDEKEFPARVPACAGRSVIPIMAWLSAASLPFGEMPQWSGAAALSHADVFVFEYPSLIDDGQLTSLDRKGSRQEVRDWMAQARLNLVFLAKFDLRDLDDRKVDLILSASTNFFAELEYGDDPGTTERPLLKLQGRDDDRSRHALHRLVPRLEEWKNDLKKVRLARKGLTERYIDPFEVRLPQAADSGRGPEIVDLVVRIFPFLLVMWTLAGALYPAVDLCAGEKERGTMETLLITPAGREELVLGKFLTIWVISSATALLNLLSMGIASAQFSSHLSHGDVSIAALAWCLVLSLPQSAFFSAISLAIGAYARSSKEGQYYLMPLFLLTMPLIFLTLAPGVELNPFYSMVPVTGVALLMQRLMTASDIGEIPWAYFIPVIAPMGLYSWLALRWAIVQFNREEVLFREAERLDLLLWLKRLFREKEPLPTTGEAFFCLGMLIGLRWVSLGLGDGWVLELHTIISQLAFVAAPPLFMVILLNTRPARALYLRWPSGREAALAAVLALLLLPPMAGLAQAVAQWLPHLLEGKHPLIGILNDLHVGSDRSSGKLLGSVLAFALVPAICEEIAFRGFVLCGLHLHFRPRNAILLSSFFYALFHMNVFLFLPTFILGVVLGLLTVRSCSLLPAILFHFLHNSVLIALIPLRHLSEGSPSWIVHPIWQCIIGSCLVAACALLWWLYRKPYADSARQETPGGTPAHPSALHNDLL